MGNSSVPGQTGQVAIQILYSIETEVGLNKFSIITIKASWRVLNLKQLKNGRTRES